MAWDNDLFLNGYDANLDRRGPWINTGLSYQDWLEHKRKYPKCNKLIVLPGCCEEKSIEINNPKIKENL